MNEAKTSAKHASDERNGTRQSGNNVMPSQLTNAAEK
jgi:hypothetical protein